MTRIVVNVTEARDNLSELLGRVKFGEDIVTVEKKGKPYAVIMNPDEYERYKDIARKNLQTTIDAVQANNADVNAEQVLEDVTQTVERVRQERYEKGA
jgi:prevent-host-death family protein